MANQPPRAKGAGLGVDARGGPVVDPTENVIALVQANKERADDLRKADRNLAKAELKAVRREAKLRTWHNKEMRKLESGRLDAIRNVDVAARITDQKTALDAIQALAAQTQSNRDALSKQVADVAAALAEANKPQLDRIAALERTSYMGAGEKAVADPAMALLAESVAQLVKQNAQGSGERRGATTAVLGMKDLVLFALAVGAGIIAFLK
jgi:hypothetical protein